MDALKLTEYSRLICRLITWYSTPVGGAMVNDNDNNNNSSIILQWCPYIMGKLNTFNYYLLGMTI